MRKLILISSLMILLAGILVSADISVCFYDAQGYPMGDCAVSINEFESNPASGSGSEWVEIFNAGQNPIDINNWKLYDGLASESLKHTFDNVLEGREYYVVNVSGLNNGGEFLTLRNEGSEDVDWTPTLEDMEGDNRTQQRIPDGTGDFVFKEETKGKTNENVTSPQSNQTNQSITQNVTVRVLSPPTIKLGDEPEGNGDYDFDGKVYANLSADSFSSSCQIKWETAWEEILVNKTLDSHLYYIDGLKEVRYRCYDDHGNFITAKDEIEVLIGWEPNISIVSPLPNKFYPINNISIIIHINTNVKKIMYSDGTIGFRTLCENCSYFNGYKTFPEGHHNFMIKVIDNFDRAFFSEEIEFDVDGHVPKIRRVSPRDGEYSNGIFTVEYTEELLQNITLFWKEAGETGYNSSVDEDCPSGRNQECVFDLRSNFSNVEDKIIEFYFEVRNYLHYDRSAVNTIHIDTMVPKLKVYSPENKTYDSQRVPFNISLSEEVKELSYINWNDRTPRWKRLCSNCKEYGSDRLRTLSLGGGWNNITIRVIDKAGNKDEEHIRLFIDSKNPIISRTEPRQGFADGKFLVEFREDNPTNLTLFYGNSMKSKELNISENCSEENGIYSCNVWVNLSEFDGGEIEYWFSLEDIAGNKDESRHEELKVDFSPPIINSINYSLDGRKVKFTINITEKNFNKVSYIDLEDEKLREKRLCSRLRNDICEGGEYFRDGKHNLTITVSDKAGNSDSQSIEFFIDSKKPRILKVRPKKNGVINGSEFYIKYTEDNLREVSVVWNPVQVLYGCNESGRNKECTVSLNLSDYDGKWINYYFNVSDIVRSVLSRETRVLVDTTLPVLNVYSPYNKTGNESYERRVPFNITISEDVKLEYYDKSEARPRWKRICTRCDEYGFDKVRTISFKRGVHHLLIRAVDNAGNSDTKEIEFEVDY